MTASPAKTILVTGASRGIGRAMALAFGAAGHRVLVNYAHSEKEAAELVADIEKAGGKALAVRGDVGVAAEAEHLFSEAEKAFGPVDVLVNNAGVMHLGPLEEVTEEAFDQLMRINLKGSFLMMQLAAKRLAEGGRIINLSTSALGTSMPGYAVYNASKAAVEALTRVLAKELGTRQITVNAIAPGPVATELFFQGKSDEFVARIKGMIPLGRLGEVEDIARIVSFLAREESGWINGQVLRANGGMV